MARELPEPAPQSPRTIDWSKYDTGRPWELVRGEDEDFDQDPRAAAHAARQWGYYNHRRLTIRRFEDRIVLYIHPKEGSS